MNPPNVPLWPGIAYAPFPTDTDDAEAMPEWESPVYKPKHFEYPCECDIKLLLSYGHEKDCLYYRQRLKEKQE
jgi:hypothetical protein